MRDDFPQTLDDRNIINWSQGQMQVCSFCFLHSIQLKDVKNLFSIADATVYRSFKLQKISK